ncbi:methionyl-tRNA synthetase [Wallemia mellicola]|nr:methionyl-tRNA synthetase [Wallemia mellicola]
MTSVNEQVLRKLVEKDKVILPKDNEDNILISSALPCKLSHISNCNNVPHLGNVIGSTLSADVFARYNRIRNRNTLYICGTDEYGTATETKAIEDGITPKELCDKYTAIHKEVYDWFEIEFDKFGRTSTDKQTEIVQDFYKNIRKNNLLVKSTKEQIYSVEEDKFLADRFVEGTCPYCQADDARGDQCDKCSRTFDSPLELLNPRSKMNPKSQLVTRPTAHMYLDLGKLQPALESWLKDTASQHNWPGNIVINSDREIVEARMKAGLQPSAITRDLKWGVPVPAVGEPEEDAEMAGKVMYVWMDAPIGYISITANYTDEWQKWWLNPKNVNYYQFMGKDNVYFHLCFFPSLLVADGRDWTRLKYISSTDYLQYEGGKFSKSKGVGVFGNSAKDTGISPSVWRFFLLSRRPESGDTEFTWNEFIGANNNHLLKNFGNYVNRVLKFTAAKFDSTIPGEAEDVNLQYSDDPDFEERKNSFIKDINEVLTRYIDSMERANLRSGLDDVLALSRRGNEWIQENKLDNALLAENPRRAQRTVLVAANLIYIISAAIHPFMPSTSESIINQLDAPARTLPESFAIDLYPGHKIGTPSILFTRIDEKMEDVWRQKFGGSQDGQPKAPELSKKQLAKQAKAAKAAKESAKVPDTPEAKALNDNIITQGNRIRDIKSGVIKDADLGKEVAQLKQLKNDMDVMIKKLESL